MRVVVALTLSSLAINPAAARDVKCDRWTDAHGRNLMKCEYVEAPQAPAAPPAPVQARPEPSAQPVYNQVQQPPPQPLPPRPPPRRAIIRFGPFFIIVR
jgi:hypothetical protein